MAPDSPHFFNIDTQNSSLGVFVKLLLLYIPFVSKHTESMQPNTSPNDRPQSTVQIVVGEDKTFQIDLFQGCQPFDLTNVTAIAATFPGANQTPVVITKLSGAITIVGAPGAGRIQIAIPLASTALMLPNPFPPQYQDLQIAVVTTVLSVDTTSIFILRGVLNIVPELY